MLYQRNLKLLFQRLKYHLCNLRWMSLIPIFLIYGVILPLCLFAFHTQKPMTAYFSFSSYTQLFVPALSVFWILFTLREYLEANGNEVLFLYHRKNVAQDTLCLFVLFLFFLLPFYYVASFMFPTVHWDLVKMVLICIFCLGAVYALTFLTRSFVLTWMVLLIYIFFGLMINGNKTNFPFYYSLQTVTASTCKKFYLPLAGIGVVLFILGFWRCRKNIVYR